MIRKRRNESGYPRVYVMGARGIMLALGWFFIVGAVIRTSVDMLSGRQSGVIHTQPFSYLLCSVCLGVWFLWLAGRRFILDENSVELVSWFSRRRLERDEIRGRRVQTSYRGMSQRQVLYAKDDAQRPMLLPLQLKVDKYFHDFTRSVPLI